MLAKQILSAKGSILIVREDGALWAVGHNEGRFPQIDESPIIKPKPLNLSIQPDEQIIRFEVGSGKIYTAIYTNKQRLVIMAKNSRQINIPNTNSSVPDFFPSSDYWPEPNPIVSSSYTNSDDIDLDVIVERFNGPRANPSEPTVDQSPEPASVGYLSNDDEDSGLESEDPSLQLGRQPAWSQQSVDEAWAPERDEAWAEGNWDNTNGWAEVAVSSWGDAAPSWDDVAPTNSASWARQSSSRFGYTLCSILSGQQREEFFGVDPEELSTITEIHGLPSSEIPNVYHHNPLFMDTFEDHCENTKQTDQVYWLDNVNKFAADDGILMYQIDEKNYVHYPGVETSSSDHPFDFAFVRTQHTCGLVSYYINIPAKSQDVSYGPNFILATDGSYGHIYGMIKDPAEISHIHFSLANFGSVSPKEIFLSHDALYIHRNQTLYGYLYSVLDFRPIICNRRSWPCDGEPLCLGLDGSLIDYFSGKIISAPDPWLQFVIDYVMLPNQKYLIIVDVPDAEPYRMPGDILFINSHQTRYIHVNGVSIIENKNATSGMVTYSTEKLDSNLYRETDAIVKDSLSYYRYELFESIPGQKSIYPSDTCYLVQTVDRLYWSDLALNPRSEMVREINLETVDIHVAVDKKQVIWYHALDRNTKEINIESVSNHFDSLCSIAEMFPAKSTFAIKYTKQSKIISTGAGVTRDFVQDAISKFTLDYLTMSDGRIVFKIDALLELQPHKLFSIGRALRCAIKMNQSCLATRLPLELIEAIYGTKFNTNELEYFLEQIQPDIFTAVIKCRFDSQALADAGYDDYDSCLRHCLALATDPVIIEKIKIVAEGFRTYLAIPCSEKMNAATLDYYLSGTYHIDRAELKRRIVGPLSDFVRKLVNILPEQKLAVLLRNWVGTTIVNQSNYTTQTDSTNNGRIFFGTCASTLTMDPTLIRPDSPVPLAIVIDMLTTPVTHIRN